MTYECVVCGFKAESDTYREPWGWTKDALERDRCPLHAGPCCECGEAKNIVRAGCAFGCRACGALWVQQFTMLSAPLFDPRTITFETLVVTSEVYKKMRQGWAKFDVQCVMMKLEKKSDAP